jgi:hypothetical protein
MTTIERCLQCAEPLTENESLCEQCFETMPMGEWVTMEKVTGLSFPCTCNGCRGRTADLDSVWDTHHIPAKVQGYYFSESTRRFFHSRVLSFRHLAGGSLAVRESLAGDMNNETRVHRVTVWCRYGHILPRELSADTFDTGVKAIGSMRALPDDAAQACECHGCQLDRAGR